MSTFFLSVTQGAGGPPGPGSNVCCTEGTVTVAAAAINVKIDTGIAPNLGYSDAIAMIQSALNYVQSDLNTTATSRVLKLNVP